MLGLSGIQWRSLHLTRFLQVSHPFLKLQLTPRLKVVMHQQGHRQQPWALQPSLLLVTESCHPVPLSMHSVRRPSASLLPEQSTLVSLNFSRSGLQLCFVHFRRLFVRHRNLYDVHFHSASFDS